MHMHTAASVYMHNYINCTLHIATYRLNMHVHLRTLHNVTRSLMIIIVKYLLAIYVMPICCWLMTMHLLILYGYGSYLT